MTQVDLYETADGKLLLVNEPAALAWRLEGYNFPGKALTDLRRAAIGQSPRWAFGARPAPGVSGPELVGLTLAARLQDGVYTVYLKAAGPAARSYLGSND